MDKVAINDVKSYETSLFTFLTTSPLFKPYKYLVSNTADRKILALC
jgi:hypothetical protein